MDILEQTVLRHVSLHTTGFNVVKHVPVKNHHAIMSMDAIPLRVSSTCMFRYFYRGGGAVG